MSVRIKIAENAKELDDVFRLRYQVYIEQENVLKGIVSDESRSVFNRFDALPPVANIIAYSGEEAVGTLRINLDTGSRLPADEIYDYTQHRERVTEEWMQTHDEPPRFVGAGMLAILMYFVLCLKWLQVWHLPGKVLTFLLQLMPKPQGCMSDADSEALMSSNG